MSEKSPLRENASPIHAVTANGHPQEHTQKYEELTQTANGNTDYIDENHQLTIKQAARWRLAALVISWISIILICILGSLSFAVSVITKSAAAFGFGFDCILDIFTSAIVIWRFYGSVGTLYSAERERMSLIFLGIIFTLASISIGARAVVNLASETHTIPHFSLYVLAATSGVICLVFALIKFVIASKLESRSLRTDALSSLAGSILGFSILLSTEVIKRNEEIWYLDEVVAIAVGLFLGVYGTRLLVDIFMESSFPIKICCCWEKQSDSSNVI
ncbi:transmembrane protein 163a-like [Antedon mediterranea]|uniref:transmembrane protein 163a-like n=1 Tax=Antedon mediterranea TaxID=105859 RepID=UPI003AF6B696